MQHQRALKRQKDVNRLERRKNKGPRDPASPSEDPGIAGIVPGPQPPVAA